VSPTVFRSGGYRFYFFSREETRKHVHVHHAAGEAKFWLEPEIELARNCWCGGTGRRSKMRGKRTSKAEVQNISPHGFWLLVEREELFVPFDEFPWFKDAPISHVLNVQLPSKHHLYWPDLDVDIAVDSIKDPSAFPLISRRLPNKALQTTSRPRAARRAPTRSRAARG
jgi:hypothetical protein